MSELVFTHVTKQYRDGLNTKTVIDNMNFTVQKGELIGVVGPSGSGKSTFLSMAGALLSPTSGNIHIGDQDITQLSQQALTQFRLHNIGFIFQGSNLIPYLKTFEQLQLVRKLAKLPKEHDQLALELLERLNLSHALERYPDTLSGGEKQRVAVARAFVNDSKIILADEPTASVDVELGDQVVAMIRQEVKERNKAAIIVTHDERILPHLDTIYRLEKGTLRQMT